MKRPREVLEDMRVGMLKRGLLSLINDLPNIEVMAEIGSFKGESTVLFMESGKVNKLFSIDPWAPMGPLRYGEAEKIFDKVIQGRNVVKLKMTMKEASLQLPMLDFVYIDGNHSYEWVKSDIEYVLPLIKPSGIIAGHDYSLHYEDTVVRAVVEMLGVPDKVYEDTSWIKWKL